MRSVRPSPRFGQTPRYTADSCTSRPLTQRLPGVYPLSLPNRAVTALTGVTINQYLSEKFLVFGGKLNTLDGYEQPLTGSATDSAVSRPGGDRSHRRFTRQRRLLILSGRQEIDIERARTSGVGVVVRSKTYEKPRTACRQERITC